MEEYQSIIKVVLFCGKIEHVLLSNERKEGGKNKKSIWMVMPHFKVMYCYFLCTSLSRWLLYIWKSLFSPTRPKINKNQLFYANECFAHRIKMREHPLTSCFDEVSSSQLTHTHPVTSSFLSRWHNACMCWSTFLTKMSKKSWPVKKWDSLQKETATLLRYNNATKPTVGMLHSNHNKQQSRLLSTIQVTECMRELVISRRWVKQDQCPRSKNNPL